MMNQPRLAVRVRAPSRLHFGLLAFGQPGARQFGGVGVMVERPVTELVVGTGVETPEPGEPHREAQARAGSFVEQFLLSLGPEERALLPHGLGARVCRAAPEHVGLGSGTQLAMAVARAMAVFAGMPELPAEELARRVGRGTRSAVGVHGFQRGGFLVEGGKHDPALVSPLVASLSFPQEWHFVLVIPRDARGLHGDAERDAFEGLAPIPEPLTAELTRLTLLGMLPAVAERDFPSFSDSLFEFGQRAGRSFSACQGGVYSWARAAEVVESVRRLGIRGIAQTSWGPTLCAVTDSRFQGEWLAARLPDALGGFTADIVCTPANNLGARVEVVDGKRPDPLFSCD